MPHGVMVKKRNMMTNESIYKNKYKLNTIIKNKWVETKLNKQKRRKIFV